MRNVSVPTDCIPQVKNPSLDMNMMTKTNIHSSANSDVYLGYVTWAAGSFDSTYGQSSMFFVASCTADTMI